MTPNGKSMLSGEINGSVLLLFEDPVMCNDNCSLYDRGPAMFSSLEYHCSPEYHGQPDL